MVVGDLLRRNAQLYARRHAWVYQATSRTWAAANRRTNAGAHALLGLGLRPGDRVALVGKNSLLLAELYFALAKAGLVAVPLSPTLAVERLIQLLDDAGAAAVVVEPPSLTEPLRAGLPQVRWWIGLGGGSKALLDYEQLVACASPAESTVVVPETALRAIHYTTGANGQPRGCLSTHRQLLQSVVVYATQLPFTPDDICLLVLPLTAGVGSYLLTAYAYAAACTVILPQAEPAAILAAVERHRVTRLYLVPELLQALLDQPDLERYDLSSLRLIGCAGPCPSVALVRRAVQRLGAHRLYQTFGSGETGGFIAYLYPSDHHLEGLPSAARAQAEARLVSCGRAAPFARLRVADIDGRELPRGTVGELLVRADTVTDGYWNDAAASAHLLRDGWLHTGELARMDRAGYVTLVTHKLEIPLERGLERHLAVVDVVLHEHPAVLEAAVLKVPDAYWGESARALVVLREDTPCTAEELQAYCRERLTGQALPPAVERLPALPRSSLGQLLERELRERYRAAPPREGR
ncbi:MAG TPA: AMP-binding protein [Chloroflexota bacterium]|nr:AMP-binding protein [Chloroflexota bacterium]